MKCGSGLHKNDIARFTLLHVYFQENVKLGRADEFEGIHRDDDTIPHQGMVEFENVTARYPLRFEIILKHLTFQIMPGQHVAIVGRTGSGKSSLIMSLFRMLENLGMVSHKMSLITIFGHKH